MVKKFIAKSTFVVVSLSIALLTASPAYAASASIYFSGATSVLNNNIITISIVENSGSEPVNAVQANFSYPASLLQFVAINSTAAFGIAAQSTGGGGTVQIGRGSLTAVTGAQTVATIDFRAISGSGSAALSFISGTSVVSANTSTNIVTSNPGTSITLTSPVSPPTVTAPPQYGTPPPKPAPTTTPVPAPIPTPPPVISQVKVSSITFTSAVITWTTSQPADSEVDYGLTSAYGITASDSNLVTNHSIALQSPLLVPGIGYHFLVKSADSAGNKVSSSDASFSTKGVSLTLTVLDSKTNQPLADATVTANGQTGKTDINGQFMLTNLPIGKMPVAIKVGDTVTIETISIDSVTTGTPQKAFFKLSAQKATVPLWTNIILVTLIVTACAALLKWKIIPLISRLVNDHFTNKV